MREVTKCDQCHGPDDEGDDHPKVHQLGGGSYHHDCTPATLKAAILDGAHGTSREVTAEIFQVCEDGKRGDELLAHIQELHGVNND